MTSTHSLVFRHVLIAGLLAAAVPAQGRAEASPAARWFADRPVAWQEHDDADVPRQPAPNDLQDWMVTLMVRDSLALEVDRVLALEGLQAAEDVNALDEVPCSTWFCARNHRQPMSPAEVAAGPPSAAPRLPLRIVKGKDQGATTGFQVVDAEGKKFMLKVDPAGHLGMSTGAEIVGGRLFHAAGYHVPASFVLDLGPDQLLVDDKAVFKLYRVQDRPLTADRVRGMLANVARTDGRLRVVLVPWIPGRILGGFDMMGVRDDDPNDRIPHQQRRSLRASWVLFSWLAVIDPSSINTIDSYVEEDGRHFVRHHIFDFGAGLGSSTVQVKGPHQPAEYAIELGRTLGALAAFGFYRRPFQDDRQEWEQLVHAFPSIGWFPAQGYDPDRYRPNRKVPSHMRRTDRDKYWGAKLVTAFTNEQIAAVVAAARFPQPDAAWVEYALEVRRDIIGRRYLRQLAAVEDPVAAPGSIDVCFQDLAIARGYADAAKVRYDVTISDGQERRLLQAQRAAAGERTCVPFAAAPVGTGYRVVEVTTQFIEGVRGQQVTASKPSRIHLRWRERERRFVVVGLERDE
jgi:hypothetical protein